MFFLSNCFEFVEFNEIKEEIVRLMKSTEILHKNKLRSIIPQKILNNDDKKKIERDCKIIIVVVVVVQQMRSK